MRIAALYIFMMLLTVGQFCAPVPHHGVLGNHAAEQV